MSVGTGWADGQSLVAAFVANEHPRGRDGRFIEVGGLVKFLDSITFLWRTGKVDSIGADGNVKVNVDEGGGKTSQELLKPSALYSADKSKKLVDVKGWIKTGAQAGSNAGGFFADKSGDQHYVKTLDTPLHVGNEVLAHRMYQAAGAAAPDVSSTADGKRFVTKIEKSDDWHTLTGTRLDDFKKEVAKDFVVDCWLANWDAPLNDNIRVTKDGTPLRVDAGGAIMFRARGGRRNLTPVVRELQSMRDPAVNGAGANMYSAVTKTDELDGAKRILAISPNAIKRAVAEEGLPAQVATELIARRDWLATHYGLTLPESTDAGRKLLAELDKTPDTLTPDEVEAVAEVTKLRLAPDGAVALAEGAPVWVKDKTSGVADGKVPDLMVVDSVRGDWVWLKSLDGKVRYGNVNKSGLEVLRENNASENAEYSTGENPQIGDRVDQGKFGPGIVVDMFPLYMRVAGDDGKNRVLKISKAGMLNRAGTYDPPKTAAPAAAAAAGVDYGPKADTKNPQSRFPLLAYSLPHRVNVLVVDHDDDKKRSQIMLSDGTRAWVPDDKLYDADKVDRAKVDALPARTVATPAVSLPAALASAALLGATRNNGVVSTVGSIQDFDDFKALAVRVNRASTKIASPTAGSADGKTPADVRAEGVAELKAAADEMAPLLSKLASSDTAKNAGDGTDEELQKLASEALATSSELSRWTPPAPPKAVNVSALPDKDVMLNANHDVKTTLKPGERLLKFKDRSTLSFFKVKTDGTLEFLGDNKRGAPQSQLDIATGSSGSGSGLTANEEWRHITSTFMTNRDVTDITPAKYDAAAVELGATSLDFSKYERPFTLTWNGYDVADLLKVKVKAAASGGYPEYSTVKKNTVSSGKITLQTGDKLFQVGAQGGPVVGMRSYYDDLSAKDAQTAPMLWLERNGVTYNLGWHGANAGDDPSKWEKLSTSDAQAYHDVLAAASNYPVVKLDKTLSDGTVLDSDYLTSYGPKSRKISSTNGISAATSRRDALDALSGTYVDPNPSYGTGYRSPLFKGSKPAMTVLENSVKNWKTGKPTAPVIAMGTESVSALAATREGNVVTDYDKTPGFAALSHKITADRTVVQAGGLDDTFDKIMTTPKDSIGSTFGSSGLFKAADGTVHADPYMYEFAAEYDGHQNVLNLPAPAFNAVKAMTGMPSLHRFVDNAQHRDEIKTGAHFNGTGVYGNGVYTAAQKGAASGYGGAAVELTPKPGARGIDNDEMYRQQAEDIAAAVNTRASLLSTMGAPDPQDIELQTVDQMGAREHAANMLTSLGLTDSESKTAEKLASLKAAAAYAKWFKGLGFDVETTAEKPYSFYGSTPSYEFHVTAKDKKTGSKFKLSFKKPFVASETNYGRRTAVDTDKYYSLRSELLEAAASKKGSEQAKRATRIVDRQKYNSGWFFDNTADVLDAAGIGSHLAEWDNGGFERVRQVSSRISFMTDAGRWALASGYDYFYVPGQDYYIFTHRAAFVVKK